MKLRNMDSLTSKTYEMLTSPPTIKDLGIIVDPQLKFNHHILEMVKKANQRAALIHRSFVSKNTDNLIVAFKTYV